MTETVSAVFIVASSAGLHPGSPAGGWDAFSELY